MVKEYYAKEINLNNYSPLDILEHDHSEHIVKKINGITQIPLPENFLNTPDNIKFFVVKGLSKRPENNNLPFDYIIGLNESKTIAYEINLNTLKSTCEFTKFNPKKICHHIGAVLKYVDIEDPISEDGLDLLNLYQLNKDIIKKSEIENILSDNKDSITKNPYPSYINLLEIIVDKRINTLKISSNLEELNIATDERNIFTLHYNNISKFENLINNSNLHTNIGTLAKKEEFFLTESCKQALIFGILNDYLNIKINKKTFKGLSSELDLEKDYFENFPEKIEDKDLIEKLLLFFGIVKSYFETEEESFFKNSKVRPIALKISQ